MTDMLKLKADLLRTQKALGEAQKQARMHADALTLMGLQHDELLALIGFMLKRLGGRIEISHEELLVAPGGQTVHSQDNLMTLTTTFWLENEE